MKVRCKNIFNEHTKQFVQHNDWLTIGQEYIVFEVRIYPSKIYYRLVGDNKDRMPALYNPSQFDIVCGKISKIWAISQPKEGIIVLGPSAWKPLEFWENCYDGDPKSLEIYRHEARIMYAEAMSLLE